MMSTKNIGFEEDTPTEARANQSAPQRVLSETAEMGKRSELFVQPMQSVAVSPRTGAVTKRMMLSWLYFLKQIQDMPQASTYRFPMAPLLKFLESREYEDIKNDLRSLNATQVEWNNYRDKDDETSWGVSTLLSQVEIITSKNCNYIEVSLPPKIEKGIRERKAYSELNLLLARQLRSTAALNLYRICVAYETNPSRVTFRAKPEEWYPKLAGNPMPPDSAFEYKYFKRDTLRPAIAEINTLTDLIIELVEHREGKRVKEIQFSVNTKPQGSLDLESAESDDMAVLAELHQMGVRRHSDAVKLLRQYGAEHIKRNIEYTKRRKQVMGPTMRDVGLYLKKAIREDYASDMESAEAAGGVSKTSAETASKEETLRNDYKNHRLQQARAMFAEMHEQDSNDKWEEYLRDVSSQPSAQILSRQAQSHGLKSKAVEIHFLTWLAEQTFGPVTEKDLLRFLLDRAQA